MTKEIKLTILFLLILSPNMFAQGSQSVEMADLLRQSGKIYTVVFGLVVILTGMIIFLIRVDRKIAKIEKEITNEHSGNKH